VRAGAFRVKPLLCGFDVFDKLKLVVFAQFKGSPHLLVEVSHYEYLNVSGAYSKDFFQSQLKMLKIPRNLLAFNFEIFFYVKVY